jgi:thioredoxin reductase
MTAHDLLEVLIIGGGFAGLTAAVTLARQLHTVAIFDSGSYRNARSTHLHVMPTWDHQDPERFRAAARADLAKYESIQLHSVEIKSIAKAAEGGFEATDANGRKWRGRKVILASGVEEIFPDIPGYEDCWAYAMYTAP